MSELHNTHQPRVTRRSLLAIGGTGIYTASAFAQDSSSSLTASQLVELIQKNVGVPWRAETVDKIKAGSPDTPVKGITTSMVATMDVLHKAAKSGRNFIVVHEPTFYSHLDDMKEVAEDPVFLAKKDFIEKNNLVVFRFHDHWHQRRPDGIITGMATSLGWEPHRDPENARVYKIPPTTLGKLVKDIRQKLKVTTARVVGDPDTPVAKAGFNPGSTSLRAVMGAFQRLDVDAFVAGEMSEWQCVEYVRDLLYTGKKKGLVVLGHVVSEENGMNECARWLKTFVSGIPIDFVPAGEPFWRA